MNKKISKKDKEDWENFLNHKKKTFNKDSEIKKNIENRDANTQDWKNFLNNNEKIFNKDLVHKKKNKI